MSRSLYDKLYRRFGETLPDSEISARSQKLVDIERALWHASSLSPECKSRLKRTRVAIVGGGFAGMMAAWSLCQKEKEIEVVVFEARDEVGGRVRSDRKFTKGRIIDFGAELVGANHPCWLGLAQELGVGLMTRTGEDHFALQKLEMKLLIDGKNFKPDEGRQLTDKLKEILKEIGKDAKQIDHPDHPWDQPALQEKFDKISVADKLAELTPKLKIEKLTRRLMEILLGNDLLAPLDKINYLGLLCLVKAGRFATKEDEDRDYLGFWEQTEAFRCTDGCQALVKAMATKLKEKGKYKFTLLPNTPVRTIEIDVTNLRPVKLKWDPSEATKEWKNPSPNFDYIILATPPSVWAGIKITPDHPKDVIGQPQMGNAVKFFSNLKDRFWIAEGAAPSGIFSELGMIWEGTDNQMLVDDQEIELSVFSGGLAKTPPASEFKRKLRELYPVAYEKSRKDTKLVNWPEKEDFIMTGYSCPRKGHMFTMAPELQKPLNSGRMFLAGEHTQTDFFGFMEGALRSGRRAAQQVIAKVCPGHQTDFPQV